MQLSIRIAPIAYVCISCIRRLANHSTNFARLQGIRRLHYGSGVSSRPFRHSLKLPTCPRTYSSKNVFSTGPTKKPFRIAIIGSGPAGFYSAYRLMGKAQDAVVDMYEQLPVPYGLVRFGVAPDHPEVKNCQDKFEEVAESQRFNYIGNVRVGEDVSLAQMKPHYDAILFSYGASEDKRLGIPGEALPGVFSAREFVGWYNGLPQFQDLAPDLDSGDQAVIVGQGNVALDVARVLLTPPEILQRTDITERALEMLRKSKIRSVKVVGRRGPLQASYTVKEVRELMNIPSVAFHPIENSLYPSDVKSLPRIQRRIAEVILKGTKTDPHPGRAHKSWELGFLKAPTSMNASASGRLSSVTFTDQAFSHDTDTFSKSASVVPTDKSTTYAASIAFRSVGYKSAPLPGLSDLGVPFDTKLGIIPNDPYGRIIAPSEGPGALTAGHIPGLYCAGWVKRGPTGVIATTMDDAFISADVIANDWESSVPFLNSDTGGNKSTGLGWDALREDVLAKGVRPLSWQDWKRIDEVERKRGAERGKEREKFGTVEEMLKVLDV